MIDHIRCYIEHHALLLEGSKVIVGVSGGVDSMVLLQVLQTSGYEAIAAHVNYGLRGAASDEDQALVGRYCNEKDIEYHAIALGKGFKKQLNGRSLQEAARTERYRFFGDLARKLEVQHVAVAHHLDDQAETVLQHLMRGSGIEGLRGMPPSRLLASTDTTQLIRPLLSCSRLEIVDFAEENGIPWLEDRSNASDDYDRNRIRNHLLSVMREQFGDAAVRNIARSANYLQGYYEHTIAPDLEARFTACSPDEPADQYLLLEALAKQPDIWQTRLVIEALERWMGDGPYRATQADAVTQLLTAQVGRKVLLAQGTVWRERDRLVFRRKDTRQERSSEPMALYPGDRCALDEGILSLATEAYKPGAPLDLGTHEVLMDLSRLVLPLVVRPWESGDRLRPLGMAGEKKVSDLLTDDKVPTYLREKVPVVLSGEEIVWVAGVRLAESVKVNLETVRVARMKYQPV